MTLSISNSALTIVKKHMKPEGFHASFLIIALAFSALFLTACSSADGTDLEPRDEILQSLRDQGFVFNKFVISTVYGENKSQVIVSGQLARKTPDETHVTNGVKLTQYRNIIVENKQGEWEIISAPPIERDQFTSRERWKN